MSSQYLFQDEISKVKGIGESTAQKLLHLNIETVGDLVKHFPSRYFDFTKPVLIKHLQAGKTASTVATIGKINTFFTKSGKLMCQATAKDSSGKIQLTWFNNPYIKKILKENLVYTIAGKVSFWGKGLTIVSPIIEEGNTPSINTSGYVPIYPQTAGITSRWIRTKVFNILQGLKVEEPLTKEILALEKIIPNDQAYSNIHFPQNNLSHNLADKRLSFNVHLHINLTNQLELLKLGKSIPLKIDKEITSKSIAKLPFTLTSDQNKTVESILKDLNTEDYTHRLIQGDTGSGKTATIIVAANHCLNNQKSCAIMAPTEILATQHYHTFLSNCLYPSSVQLITASTKEKPNFDKPGIYIGTHSLLTNIPQKIKHSLAFVAIDEQHKFGVKQRDELKNRTPVPHLFNLSATPIPRTVALGLLGDIHISNITQKPINRKETKTFIVTPSHFKKSPEWLREQLKGGSQIFVVCPNIADHDSEVASVEKITKQYQKIANNEFPVYSIHGKMNSKTQNETISSFIKGQHGILVSTSLIEVGIDIPSANIMIIHSAERFGLASLHQLRGRVGRGQEQGFCFLVPSTDEGEETERLQLLQKYKSGLILAQKDLRLRGAGEVFGTKQHGALPTRLRYFWSRKTFLKAKNLSKIIVKNDPSQALQIACRLETC